MKTKISRFPVLSFAVVTMFAIINVPHSITAEPVELFVTQSPPGPQNADPANWSGVLQYRLNASGGAMIAEAGVDKTNLADPAGLAFRASSSELFVGNRWGNSQPSSISRFIYDSITRRLTTNGVITGNSLFGVCQIAFNPVTGEMFAANFGNGVSRFTFDTNGTAQPNGIIGDGSTRGVAVSPDGRRLYVTSATTTIRQFDLISDGELSSVTVPGSGGLHFFAFRARQLYVAAAFDNCVYRFAVGTNDDLTLLDSFTMQEPVGIAFSPDGLEMFVSGHQTSDLIYRWRYVPVSDSWIETGTFDAHSSLAGVLAIPGGGLDIAFTPPGGAVIYWPSHSSGWTLQQCSNPAAEDWSTSCFTVSDDGTNCCVTISPPAGNLFFRLAK